jgi:hypothetical protein
MKPARDIPLYSEQELFELLDRPENWPDDPAIQAQLADLLELHLALRAHASELQGALQVTPRLRVFQSAWMMAAAATLLALVPGIYAVQHTRHLKALAQDRARIEEVAQRRGQERLWAAFFQQSSDLLTKFEKAPLLCNQKDREDRNPERELAVTLLQASHQLAAQNAPNSEAETARTNLHAWLTEVSMEDGCMEPDRAAELRQWAATHNLEDESKRLGRLLKGEIE